MGGQYNSYLSVDNRFNKNDKEIVSKYDLKKPSRLLNLTPQKLLNEKKIAGETGTDIGRNKKGNIKEKEE